jgi:hypothetical protein
MRRGSCKNRNFGGSCHLHHQSFKNHRARNNVSNPGMLRRRSQLLLPANFPRSPILVTLMMAEIPSSETPARTRTTWRNMPEDCVFTVTAMKTSNLTQRRRNEFPMRFELSFYIPEDGILHSHRHRNLTSYLALTGWPL